MPKFKEKTKIIEVKPVDADDTDHIITYDESNDNASPDNRGKYMYKASSLGNTVKENATGAESEAEFVKTEEVKIKHVQTMMNLAENYEEMNRKVVDDVTKTSECTNNVDSEDADGDTTNGEKKKKKKKGKRKKKKKKDKTKAVETNDAKSDKPNNKKTNNDPQIEEVMETGPNETEEKKKQRKLPCIFGFVATWFAKRKERRREKKRKAIDARSQAPVESLVEYEHKRAKGGVAFTVEVDSRPMRKPVLPPIKQRPGPIMHGMDEKLSIAEQKRTEVREKKKQSAKDHERKKADCLEKKAESEFHFKQKAHLTIRYKQFGAEKNRARLQEDRRCSSPLLRAPSTLPPLRNVGVRQSVKVNRNGSRATDARDPDDGVFNF